MIILGFFFQFLHIVCTHASIECPRLVFFYGEIRKHIQAVSSNNPPTQVPWV